MKEEYPEELVDCIKEVYTEELVDEILSLLNKPRDVENDEAIARWLCTKADDYDFSIGPITLLDLHQRRLIKDKLEDARVYSRRHNIWAQFVKFTLDNPFRQPDDMGWQAHAD